MGRLCYVNARIEKSHLKGEADTLLYLKFFSSKGVFEWVFDMNDLTDSWIINKMMDEFFNITDPEDMEGFYVQLALNENECLIGIGDIIKDVVFPFDPKNDGFWKKAYCKRNFREQYRKKQ